ncbi:MAG: RNA polymerase sigma-70 factor [Bacteroidales bacterium]
MDKKEKRQSLNKDIFQNLFEKYYPNLCRFASGYLGDHDTAEEIVQQVFINLWNQKDSIDPERPVKSYLFTSVKNRCLNHIRDRKKFRNYYLDIETDLIIPVAEKDIIKEEDLEKQLAKALDKLPEKCREVFMLCRFEDMKYKDVAEKLGISQKTVETQMSKALKILREEFKDLLFLILFLFLISG